MPTESTETAAELDPVTPEQDAPEKDDAPTAAEPAPKETPASTETIADRPKIAAKPDADDAEYDAAIKETESDEILSPSQKRAQILTLKNQRQERQSRLQREAFEADETARKVEAKKHGVTVDVINSSWDEACEECTKELGEFDYKAAKLLFNQKLKAAKAGKPKSDDEPEPKPPLKRETTAVPPGARLTPPGGGAARADTKPAKSPEDEFNETLSKVPLNELVR